MNKFYLIPPQDLDPFIDAIAHGGEEHREWLKESVYNYFFYNRPITEARGIMNLNTAFQQEFKLLEKKLSKNELDDMKRRLAQYE